MNFESLLLFLQAHIYLAPYVLFGLMILAGFCLPISEDAMLFIAALLANKYAQYLWPIIIWLYLGIYFSDLICFSLGRFVGPSLLRFRLFRKAMPEYRIKKVERFYQRFGVITLLLGRFIPFGVRNVLYLVAGFIKMSPKKFAFVDLLASLMTTSIYFSLYYFFGQPMIDYVKQSNYIIFSLLALVILIAFLKKFLQNKSVRKNKSSQQ